MNTTNYIQTGKSLAEAAIADFKTPTSNNDTAAAAAANAKADLAEVPLKFLAASFLIAGGILAWASWNLWRLQSMEFNAVALFAVGVPVVSLVAAGWAARRSYTDCRRTLAQSAEDLKKTAQLVRERDLMRIIIDNLPDCIYAKDMQGRFVLNNIAHMKHLGSKSTTEMLGKSDFDYFPKELATQFFSDEQKIIQTGVPLINQEQFKEVYSAGRPEKRWSYSSKVLWRDPQGRVIGTVGITRDIHENKLTEEALRKSEEKLRQFTMQLERSNRELQDFAYVASHDLQEPLRKIVVFGERLKERCAETLAVEGKDYLDRMQKAAARMQVLISDLLSFSRVTTKAQPFAPVDLAKVAHEVVGDLEARIELVKGRVEVGQLPAISAEPLQMRQLIQNLIGNALKFRRPEEPPVVKVAAEMISAPRPRSEPGAPNEQLCRLTVSDNGIGFDEKYLDRIFNVFQRLHTRNEYEGTGMGLAIARKIVLYHGGDVTAKSKPGQGSTFIVTLPMDHPKDTNHEQ